MRVIKITAIWCSACLVMNKVWKHVMDKYNIDVLELDYDMNEEEVKEYHPGNVLPVFIFEKDQKEMKRIIGEMTEKELIEVIEELGFSEKVS